MEAGAMSQEREDYYSSIATSQALGDRSKNLGVSYNEPAVRIQKPRIYEPGGYDRRKLGTRVQSE